MRDPGIILHVVLLVLGFCEIRDTSPHKYGAQDAPEPKPALALLHVSITTFSSRAPFLKVAINGP